MDNKTFGSTLARYRRGHGWSQTELARQLADQLNGRQYSQTTVSQWERGYVEAPADARDALFRLFGDLREELEQVSAGDTLSPSSTHGVDASDVTEAVRRLEGFELWRSCVGLDDSFPELPVDCEPFLNLDRERRVYELIEFTASDRGPSVVISFAPGHGITTFARHVFGTMFQGHVRSAVVPVPLSLGDIARPDGTVATHEQMVDAIRRRLLYCLGLKPWQGRGKKDGIGASAHAGPFAVDASVLLDLPVGKMPGSLDQLSGRFKDMVLPELVQDLASSYSLYVSVQLDVSSSPQRPVSADLRRAIPDVFEAVAGIQVQLRETTGSTFSIVAFASNDDERLIKQALIAPGGGLANPEVLGMRPYTPYEVYRMLIERYGADLPTKLDPAVLVGMVGPGIPLRRTQALLQEYVLQWFNDPERVSYAIGPALGGPSE